MLVLLAVLVLVMGLGEHTAFDLGLAFPDSFAALCGLAVAGVVLLALHIAGKRMERRMTPAQRARQEAQVRELPFTMPRTSSETATYLLITVLMTATWEVLFRGYLLLVLPPLTGLPLAVALAAVAYAPRMATRIRSSSRARSRHRWPSRSAMRSAAACGG